MERQSNLQREKGIGGEGIGKKLAARKRGRSRILDQKAHDNRRTERTGDCGRERGKGE